MKLIFKGGKGSGNFHHSGRPGKVGGSGSGGKVWNGQQSKQPRQLTNKQTGEIGEYLAAKALEDKFGVPFSTMNLGRNNAPIDLAGDHTAVEVKAGPASNGPTAQHWRATSSTPGKAEQELLRQMSKEEKRAHHDFKRQQVLERKNAMLAEMSKIAGHDIKPMTVAAILTPDGSRGDVFMIPGFHQRLPWKDYATEQYYVGTYDVPLGQFKERTVLRFKGGPGSGDWGHLGRPGKVGGSAGGGSGLLRIGAVADRDNYEDRKILAAGLRQSRQETQAMLEQAAKELGYDGDIVFGGKGYEFQVGGQQYRAGAHYDPVSERIVMFEGALTNDFNDVKKGLLAHEVQHHKWNQVKKAAEGQRQDMMRILEAEADKPYREQTFTMSGAVRRDADIPKFSAMAFYDNYVYPYDKVEAMQRSGWQISSYADSYWNRFAEKRSTDNLNLAVNETLAEMSRNYLIMPGYNPPQEWQDIYFAFKGAHYDVTH